MQFRYLDAIARGDSAMRDELRDSVARDTTPFAAIVGTFYDPLRYGFFEEQTRVSRLALRAAVPPAMKSLHQRLLIIATAARGAWDSALVAMDGLAAEDTLQRERLGPYGMAVVAAWAGAVDAREAAVRRGAAAAAAGDDPLRLGELAWLDGIAAATAPDRKALGLAREAHRRSGDPGAEALDRALGAFEAELGGATREAGSALAGLEWEEAARGAPDLAAHPWAIAVHRLAAARWLASTGDLDQAARLLRWVDGPHLLLRSTVYGVMLSGPTFLERGRIERRRGRATQAAEYYREFLRRVDRPTPRYRPQAEEIRAILR